MTMSIHACLPLARRVAALSLLTIGVATAPTLSTGPVQAQAIDCADEANAKDWDCIQKRASQPAGPPAAPPAADALSAVAHPTAIVFTLEDAGKEATQFAAEQGEDGRGRWARSRFERDLDIAASKLGPNMIETRAWVARDVEAAKALFKEQAGIKDFPEKSSETRISGLNDKLLPFNVAEETQAIGAYWEYNTIWQHYRVVMRRGANVAVMYLYGREDLFTEKAEDRSPNGKLLEWLARKLADRL